MAMLHRTRIPKMDLKSKFLFFMRVVFDHNVCVFLQTANSRHADDTDIDERKRVTLAATAVAKTIRNVKACNCCF